MVISLIVAMSENRVVGRDGALPWHLSADLKRFRRLTMGHHLLMGRKTFQSIGRPLPGRTSIVLTRQVGWNAAGAATARTLDEALTCAAGDEEPFIIGGAETYRHALSRADRIYLTRVHAHVRGDTYFPQVDWSAWKLLESQSFLADSRNDYDYSFETYSRR